MHYVFILASSITSKNSVINKPFHYSHHQAVAGLIFDFAVILALVSWGAWIAYRNFGPPAKRRAADAAR
jgi:hypothetical protein